MSRLDARVARAAEEALAERHVVSVADVLVGIRWLAPSALDRWRQGRVDALESVVQVDADKFAAAVASVGRWALGRGLESSEVDYLARTADRRPLRFSVSGDAALERACRTQWIAADLPAAQHRKVVETQRKPPDLVVIWALNEWTCSSCGGTGDNLLIMDQPGPLCLHCAGLDHLVFLPAGDAAVTRRAKRASGLSAVVVRFSRARKRYERQGLLVEEAALESAEKDVEAWHRAR